MNFPEFITYCKLTDLFSVHMSKNTHYNTSIKTPHDEIGLHLKYEIVDGKPAIVSGQYYNYADHSVNFSQSYKITMDEIEKVFFPK